MEFTEDRMLASRSRNAALIPAYTPIPHYIIMYLYREPNTARMDQDLVTTIRIIMEGNRCAAMSAES